MEEKEKYHAEMEARLMRFGETINEIKTRMEKRKESLPNIPIQTTIKKHEDAKAKLAAMEQSDENSWHKFKTELNNLANDIDEDIRESLAYFP